MAESDLSLQYTDFVNAISDELGWGSSYAGLTAARQAVVDDRLAEAYRLCLFPPPLAEGEAPHRWSWLKPIRTITTTAPYDTGTIEVAAGSLDKVTLTDGVWPSWAADGQIVIKGVAYDVLTRDSDTQLTLAIDAPETAAGTAYTLQRRYYTLEDDFAALEGPMTYEPGQCGFKVAVVGEGKLRELRQLRVGSGRPTHVAVTWTIPAPGSAQRARMEFYPVANAAYLLTYRCKILVNKLSSTNVYPLGGMEFGETLMAAARACAEKWRLRAPGPRWPEFMQRLAASIAADRQQGAEHLSIFNHLTEDGEAYGYASPHLVTYNGYPQP